MIGPEKTSYDDVPYDSVALPETHPDRLAAFARLFGLSAPNVESCRVLELGCAAGGNLIPMAMTLPGARFVGIDLSRRQVEQGCDLVEALGLDNVELRAESILDIGSGLGRFDYILCHGVYSWVPAAVQATILRICGDCLAPEGVAYVSYNTYPGWHIRGMIREMMLVHTRRMTDPIERVREGRALLESIVAAIGNLGDSYSHCVRDEASQILPKPDYYLLHEHFEDLNQPIYAHEFFERASANGLQFLGETRLGSMACAQPTEMIAILERHFPDPLDREQYCDFLAGRKFRQTLLCRAGLALAPAPSADAIRSLRASSVARGAMAPAPLDPGVEASYVAPDAHSVWTTQDPTAKSMMSILTEARPRSLPFDELRDRVSHQLDGLVEPGPESLAAALLEGFKERVVEMHVHEPRLAAEAGDRPMASPLAHRQAAEGPRVTSLRHHIVELGEFDRMVLYHLDGRHGRDEILGALRAAVSGGALTFQARGRGPITDPREAAPILERLLDPCLERLARSGLLLD